MSVYREHEMVDVVNDDVRVGELSDRLGEFSLSQPAEKAGRCMAIVFRGTHREKQCSQKARKGSCLCQSHLERHLASKLPRQNIKHEVRDMLFVMKSIQKAQKRHERQVLNAQKAVSIANDIAQSKHRLEREVESIEPALAEIEHHLRPFMDLMAGRSSNQC